MLLLGFKLLWPITICLCLTLKKNVNNRFAIFADQNAHSFKHGNF